MASSSACDVQHEVPDGTADSMPRSLAAISGGEQGGLDYEAWRELVRSACGRYSAEGVQLTTFAGSVRTLSVGGCAAVDLSCNALRVDRTNRDARLDGMEHYYAIVQLAGRSTINQNDRVAELTPDGIALVDATRPVTYVSQNRPGRWLSLQLPRRSLISHLGMEPEGGSFKRGQTPAGRLFLRLILDAADGCEPSRDSSEPYMQMAIYDLLGALFATPDLPRFSSHTDKLFKRICNIIRDRFADPEFGPGEVAAEAGISIRYLQKLFTARSSSCTHFVHSVRLDHAARLLRRRALLDTRQPVSQIAYASGFNDYTHFARQFHRRFGHPPGVYGSREAQAQ
jgi:AraC family transcriptional regulator, positive regulator of tynA and feaB